MIRVNIIREGKTVYQGKFETDEQAQVWLFDCEMRGIWGDPSTYSIDIQDITELEARRQASITARAYLASTDWYVIRETETGVPCPEDVKVLRANARIEASS